MLLAMNRNIPQLDALMKNNHWQGITGLELKGKTIAVLGFGQIGKAVAQIAKFGFGMRVNAFDVLPSIDSDLVDYYSNDFDSVVKNADIITIHMAVMPSTKGFINSERIEKCKDGVQFINISRGDLVNEKALFEALQKKKISAAALDVFVNEPYIPTPEADFRILNNVVLTPHCGSNTKEASNKMAELVVKNILAYEQGKEISLIPELIVNKY
jgi:D-3-phosphoglycerate dehydrogenase